MSRPRSVLIYPGRESLGVGPRIRVSAPGWVHLNYRHLSNYYSTRDWAEHPFTADAETVRVVLAVGPPHLGEYDGEFCVNATNPELPVLLDLLVEKGYVPEEFALLFRSVPRA